MLAFLFLSYGEVIHAAAWETYFHYSRAKVYLHRADGLQTSVLNAKIVETVPTKWGRFSLVCAQQKLIDAALADGAETLVFVSGDSIPTRPLSDFVDELAKKPQSWLSWHHVAPWRGPVPQNTDLFQWSLSDHSKRASTLQTQHIPPDWSYSFANASQWCVLRRPDALLIQSNFQLLRQIFGDSTVPDESAYATFFVSKGIPLERRSHMYVEWSDTAHNPGCNHAHSRPRTFHNADMNRGLFAARDFFFMRKICNTVRVPTFGPK